MWPAQGRRDERRAHTAIREDEAMRGVVCKEFSKSLGSRRTSWRESANTGPNAILHRCCLGERKKHNTHDTWRGGMRRRGAGANAGQRFCTAFSRSRRWRRHCLPTSLEMHWCFCHRPVCVRNQRTVPRAPQGKRDTRQTSGRLAVSGCSSPAVSAGTWDKHEATEHKISTPSQMSQTIPPPPPPAKKKKLKNEHVEEQRELPKWPGYEMLAWCYF